MSVPLTKKPYALYCVMEYGYCIPGGVRQTDYAELWRAVEEADSASFLCNPKGHMPHVELIGVNDDGSTEYICSFEAGRPVTYCEECGHECYPEDEDYDGGDCPNCGWSPNE